MGLTTRVGSGKAGTNSLKSTVPSGAAAFLGLQAGDELDWEMQTEGDARFLIVKKVA